jgi:hypothetical protein
VLGRKGPQSVGQIASFDEREMDVIPEMVPTDLHPPDEVAYTENIRRKDPIKLVVHLTPVLSARRCLDQS